MKRPRILLVFACFVSALFPLAANALTFTLSNDAIMALDYDYCSSYFYGTYPVPFITNIKNLEGVGIQFDIMNPNPSTNYYLYWMSTVHGGNGVLVGRDISMFDAFALKFTLLSAKGVSSHESIGSIWICAEIDQSDLLSTIIDTNSSSFPSSSISINTTNAVKIGTIGFICYVPYQRDPCGITVSILVSPASDAVVMTTDSNQVFQLVGINKCTVAAGSKTGHDKISFSGKMNPSYDNLNLTNVIQFAIDSNDMPDPCIITIPISDNFKNTGKLSYSGTDENGIKKSFKLDFKTHKFSFAAQNINLTGLSCPLKVGIGIADFSADTNVNGTIVNGGKPVPIHFLMGAKDYLRIDKSKFKRDKNTYDVTQVAISGVFSAKNLNDANMAAKDFTVTINSHTFTVPAGSFKNNKGKFTCSKVVTSNGIVSATFDFNKGTFTLTIKNADFAAAYVVSFNMQFGDFSEDAEIYLP